MLIWTVSSVEGFHCIIIRCILERCLGKPSEAWEKMDLNSLQWAEGQMSREPRSQRYGYSLSGPVNADTRANSCVGVATHTTLPLNTETKNNVGAPPQPAV